MTKNAAGKGVDPVMNAGQADSAASVVGRFQHAKPGRQEKGFVHTQGRNQLLRHQIPAGISRDHQPE